jgi:hypothetical protein
MSTMQTNDFRVGIWFAPMRKFSGKTASTRRQMISKKGARKRPFPKF